MKRIKKILSNLTPQSKVLQVALFTAVIALGLGGSQAFYEHARLDQDNGGTDTSQTKSISIDEQEMLEKQEGSEDNDSKPEAEQAHSSVAISAENRSNHNSSCNLDRKAQASERLEHALRNNNKEASQIHREIESLLNNASTSPADMKYLKELQQKTSERKEKKDNDAHKIFQKQMSLANC